MTARRTTIGIHRNYPGSTEDINGQTAAADQIIEDVEIQDLAGVIDSHAKDIDFFEALIVTKGEFSAIFDAALAGGEFNEVEVQAADFVTAFDDAITG